MLGEKWITDRTPTERFPNYTRANAGEVLSNPATPLGWSFGWDSGYALGCRDGFVTFGVFDPDEYGDPPETFGSFGGYFYNSLTQARLMGVRMPGASPEAIDQAYFDAHPDVPPYEPKPWHESPEHSAKLEQTMGYCMSTDSYPPVDRQRTLTIGLRDARPDLSALSDTDLLNRARMIQPHLVDLFHQHVWASLGASLGPGAVQAICTAVGRGDDAVRIMSGIGDVDSADIARDLWQLSRLVRNSASLTALFDAGLDAVPDQVTGTEIDQLLQAFIRTHGCRGPDEWDVGADTYETNPTLVFAQLNSMRTQTDEVDPMKALARCGVERARVIDEVRAALAGDEETLALFDLGVKSGALWLAVRERCKTNNVRGGHEVRMCFHELGRRMAAKGFIAHPKQVYQLVEGELDEFMAHPGSFTTKLAEREVDFKQLFDLVPPFIVNGTCPPLTQWPRRSDTNVTLVKAGDHLTGAACSAGVVTGVARILEHADDPGALEPGDILVTDHTDPSWTPLFLVAGAVVTNVGSFGSHASIVSRELGIPCVASVADATARIPDGSTITVDGASGTVTIVSLP